MADRGRVVRFALLERVVLPMGIRPLGALMRTWRVSANDPHCLESFAASDRVLVATCHGMLLHLLACARLPSMRRRRFVVLLSPSRDGRLLATFLARFGIGHAVGTTGSHGVAGARAFARRVRAGEVGIVAVDGPRGPCARVAPGFLRIAAAAAADVYLAITTADRGMTFGSWDRAHLPAPFARVRLHLEPFAREGSELPEAAHGAERRMIELARMLGSPVLPPALREPRAKPNAGDVRLL